MPQLPAVPSRFFEGDLQQLRCFYHAALQRSFTRAAAELSIGQPSVSNHIKALEQLLGVALFRRQRRGVTLTEEGRVLFDLVSSLVEGVDKLPGELAERTAALAGQEVRLAAGQELLLHLAAPTLRTFRGRHPELRLAVYSGIRGQIHDLVAADEVHFGIAARAGLLPGLDFEEVLADELVLIAPRGHDLAARDELELAEVARHALLMPDPRSSTRRTIEQAFEERNLDLVVAMELERWHAIKEFVALGLGVAIVPRFSIAGDESRLAVGRLHERLAPTSYGIITRRGRHLPPLARELIGAIRADTARRT